MQNGAKIGGMAWCITSWPTGWHKQGPRMANWETGPRDSVNKRDMGRMCNMLDSENCIRNGIAEAKRSVVAK